METWKGILEQQFQLAYFGRVDFSDSDSMAISERQEMYRILVEQKKKEKQEADKARKAAEDARKRRR